MAGRRFSDQLRDAVAGSGMSRYAICKAVGLTQSSMSRFMNGKGGLSLDTIDKLADLLGLTVAKKPTTKRGE
jgi:transcriptional regulator with XRE-family HTH domain